MEALLAGARRGVLAGGGAHIQPPRLAAQALAPPPRPARLAALPVRAAVGFGSAEPAAGQPRQRGGPQGSSPARGQPARGGARRGQQQQQQQRGPMRQRGAKPADEQQRLNKAIASAGVASRRKADELVFEGKVSVNGRTVTEPGMRVDLRKDKVLVNGRQLSAAAAQRKYYFALNKPKGYISSNKSEHEDGGEGRLVVDLFDGWLQRWRQRTAALSRAGGPPAGLPPRLFTVGRLDVQSVGLIFVTNDGDWAHKVMHPSTGITKEYSVTLNRKPRASELDAMAAGCTMDGVFVQPVAVAHDDTDPGKPNRVRFVVAEGRNREVRNLVEHAGLEVKSLRRVRIGGYRMPRELGVGEFRELRPNEVRRVLDVGADRSV